VRTTSAWTTAVPPSVAVEIASRRVTVAGVHRHGTHVHLQGYASEPLPEGAVAPALAGVNIVRSDEVVSGVRRALERAGLGTVRRAALVVPDSIARVSLLQLEQIPARQADLDQLVRWQLRKSTPFPLEEAQISQLPSAPGAQGGTVTAVVARRDVVTQYEEVLDRIGMHAGIVDLASFNVVNALLGIGIPEGDSLLVHLAEEATTLAILRRDTLMFYRHRTAVDEEPLRALVHQTAMYHEDRLGGGGFARVWVSGIARASDDAGRQIAERLGVPVVPVDVRGIAGLTETRDTAADVWDALAAPVGVLLRDRAA
jgi:type IV pilus assembly protein PilM